MRAVVQRVSEACVAVDEDVVGRIGMGYLVLLSVAPDDSGADTDYMVNKIAGLRMFNDSDGHFNLALSDVGGEILVVSQFTLHGDARKGRRPSFIGAARPEHAIPAYESAIAKLRAMGFRVEAGRFGAHMRVSSVNDGPVTILLDSKKLF